MKLSIVLPIYNEEKIIPLLKERLNAAVKNIEIDLEIVIVDDGSHDKTSALIKEWIAEDERVILIEFSRNFGHQAAITAGLKESSGDAVVVMDADLQDPPELIEQMIEKWQQGYKIILAERKSRNENFLRRWFFRLFYKVFKSLSDIPVVSSGVFGLMDRVVVNHLLNMSEQNRFIPGLRSWIGFNSTTVWYDRDERAAGQPKQTFRHLCKYAFDAIFSFSYKPLRFSFLFGCIISIFCFLYAFVLIIQRILRINFVLGFTTSAVAIFFLGGVILISNGIIGEYLGRIYDEVKKRPLFIISKKTSRAPGEKKLSTIEFE